MGFLMRLLARAAINRPDTALVKASGGAPRVVRGRTLDPRFQFLEAQAAKRPTPTEIRVADARAQTDLLVDLFGGKPEPGVRWSDQSIPADARAIPVRVYRPVSQDATVPALVFLHFGGGVVGNVGTCHAFCTMLAAGLKAPVVSVEYRLAPEHRWPAGLDDALAAFRWTRDNAASLGAPAGKAAIGGDSMGGNFSAIVAQETLARGEGAPVVQLLIYPATDLGSTHPSMTDFGDAFPLTSATMAWFMSQYLPANADIADPRLSPARAASLSGLAPALIYTAGFDPLSDQGEAYAHALRAAGVEASHHCFVSLAHAFTAFTGAIPAADAACRRIVADTAAALRRRAG